MEKQKHDKITNWLENLQRESWQLELIVSGFAIFLLIQLLPILEGLFESFNTHTNFSRQIRLTLVNFLALGVFALFALLTNLTLHIFLRGFWIAAIGLRSVQEKTDFEKLNYSPYFTDKLKRLIPPLEHLIVRLDNLASVVFAFAFLLVFMFLSFALWALFINMLSLTEVLISSLNYGFLKTISWWIYRIIMSVALISSIIYFIDTLTLGFFKKYQKISKIYYPIYRFWGWVTLAGIYRSIYHSLVSRFPKNIVRLLLFVFLFSIGLYPSYRITFYKYYPDRFSGAKEMPYHCYDNLREKGVKIWTASIASDVVDSEYLPLFIRYDVKSNEVLDTLCIDYTPTKNSIFVSGISKRGFNDPFYKEEDADKLLNCLSRLYNVYVNDSLIPDLDIYYYMHPNNNERGLRTMIYTGDLPMSKNTIRVTRQSLNRKKELSEIKLIEIPFWLESRR